MVLGRGEGLEGGWRGNAIAVGLGGGVWGARSAVTVDLSSGFMGAWIPLGGFMEAWIPLGPGQKERPQVPGREGLQGTRRHTLFQAALRGGVVQFLSHLK